MSELPLIFMLMRQETKDMWKTFLTEITGGLLIVFAMTLLASLMSSCKTVEQSEVVTEVRHDTVRIYTQKRDSVVYRDSVFVHMYEKGDTIYSITERWNVQYRDRVKIDTVYRTVYVSQKEKEEKKAPWYDKLIPWAWVVAVVGCFMFGMWCQKKK